MYKINKKAFTLVEILITLAVITVLLIVLISNVDSATDKARKTASLTDIRSLQYAALQVANQDKELTNDLNALADLLNKNLDTELNVVVENNKMKTYSTDAWGNSYQLRYSRPSNTNGQIQILSAGPDGKFETQDDIITAVVCQKLGSGTNVVVKNTVNLDDVIPDNLDPSTQTGHTCIFDQSVQTEQYLHTPGNCAIPAMYYYSCTCGNSGHTTFSGLKDPNVHIANQTYKYESANNTEHVKISMCSECQTILNTVMEQHDFKDGDCTKCNYDPHTHIYSEQIVTETNKKSNASCTSPAVYYYVCTCGAKGTQTYTHGDKLEHEYIQTISKYPSCTQKGTYLYTCNGCNNSYTEDIAMYAHSYVKENTSNQYLQTNATCKYPAKYFYTCECGNIGTNTFEYGDVDKNNHVYTTSLDYEMFDNKEHYIKTICNGCNETINSTKGNHVFNEQNTCKLCNSHSHVFDQKNNNYIKDASTCTTKTTYFYECVCGEPGTEYYEFGTLNSSNHTGTIVNVGTEEIHSKYNCCNIQSNEKHNYTETIVTAATCTQTGTSKNTCECGYSYTSTLNALGHSITSFSAKVATCTENGYAAYEACNRCSYTTYQEISATGHTEVNGGEADIHTKCSVCQTTLNTTHSYTSEISIAATCNSKGITKYTCNCGYSYSKEDIPLTYHKDTNADEICDVCNTKIIIAGGLYQSGSNYTILLKSWTQLIQEGIITNSAGVKCSDKTIAGDLAFPNNSSYTIIARNGFSGCTKLTGVRLSSYIKTINSYAFSDCTSLTSIQLNSTLTNIAEYSFQNCSSLKHIDLHEGITSIGQFAFYKCTSLTTVTMPSTLKTTGWQSFANCTSLTHVYLNEGLTEIGSGTFSQDKLLEYVIIPSTVVKLGSQSFAGTKALKSINIPASVTYIGEQSFKNSGITMMSFEDSNNWYVDTYTDTLEPINLSTPEENARLLLGWPSYYNYYWTKLE